MLAYNQLHHLLLIFKNYIVFSPKNYKEVKCIIKKNKQNKKFYMVIRIL